MAIVSTRSPAIPIDTLRSLHRLEAQMNEAANRLDGHDAALSDKLGKSNQELLGVAAFVRGQLQAGGKVPLSIAGLSGLAGQPQFAAVPQYQNLPALARAEGALSVSNGQLYYFQGASSVSNMPQWVPLSATGEVILSSHADRTNHVASTSNAFYYETDRNAMYLSTGSEWVYVCGTMMDAVAKQPTDLGGNDAGFQFLGTDNYHLYVWDGTVWRDATGSGGGGGGTGTVTSVGLSMPAEFTVTGSPVMVTGTLGAAKASQAANQVYAGPGSGASAAPVFRTLLQADMPSGIAPQVNSDWNATSGVAMILNKPALASGTVSSVGLAAPAEFTVSGSPVTGSGVLTFAKASQAQNFVWAAPSGAAGVPVFRLLAAADIPNIAESQVTNLVSDLAAKAPTARTISTTAPVTGGGDLSANRTLAVSTFTGDSGSGGASGVVPAPAAGDGASKYLKANGTWAVIAPQVNSDWNASSGVAQILNKPPITYDGSLVTTSTGNLTVTSASATATTLTIANTSTNGRGYLIQATGTSGATGAGFLAITDQATGNIICSLAGSVSTRKVVRFAASTVIGFQADDAAGGMDVGFQRISAGVLMCSDTSGNPAGFQSGSLYVNSPDKTRNLNISCANGGSPTIASTTSLTVFSSAVTFNTGVTVTGSLNANGNIGINSGTLLYVYNTANTQSCTFGFGSSSNPALTSSTGSIDSVSSIRFLNAVGAVFYNTGSTQSMSIGFNSAQPTINSSTGNVTIPCSLTVTPTTNPVATFNLPGGAGTNSWVFITQPGTSVGMNLGVSNNINNGTQPYLFAGTQLNISAPILYVTGSVSATAHNTHASGSRIEDLHAAFKRTKPKRNEFGAMTEHVIAVGGWNFQLANDGMHLVVKRSETEIVEFVLPWSSAQPV